MKQLILLLATIFLAPTLSYAQLSAVQMGRASNAYSVLRPEQNQVVAHDASQTVMFIHRQDVTIWGGGSSESGKLRFDLSTDGGTSFSVDNGVLNQNYQEPARYPQIRLLGNSNNPTENGIVWTAPSLVNANWNGVATGYAATPSIPVASTESYNFQNVSSGIQGGLCEGLPGEFWMVDRAYNGSTEEDTVRIYKGTYNSSSADVEWSVHEEKALDASLSFDGSSRFSSPNMAFSPDGQTGWVTLLGDLSGGSDSTYSPIFIKSTDAGATWGEPVEVDLRTATFTSGGTLVEELQALWIIQVGNDTVPASSGRPTCTFEHDITVDANGDPHLFAVVGSASMLDPIAASAGYTVYSEIANSLLI